MYIQKIIYDSSCNFRNNKFYPSVHESALFDLTQILSECDLFVLPKMPKNKC